MKKFIALIVFLSFVIGFLSGAIVEKRKTIRMLDEIIIEINNVNNNK